MRYVILLLFVAITQTAVAQKSLATLRQNMSVMASLPGTWHVTANEISPDGKKTALHGTYIISWALDSTYLRIAATLEENISHKKRAFECLVTYNPDSAQYELSYFYSRQAFRVFERGKWNAPSKIITTRGTLVFGGGGRYYVHTELNLTNKNEMTWNSWAKTKPEQKEFPDWEATISRDKKS
jgi:hypothetical protein